MIRKLLRHNLVPRTLQLHRLLVPDRKTLIHNLAENITKQKGVPRSALPARLICRALALSGLTSHPCTHYTHRKARQYSLGSCDYAYPKFIGINT
jgi:hypothetical protein